MAELMTATATYENVRNINYNGGSTAIPIEDTTSSTESFSVASASIAPNSSISNSVIYSPHGRRGL